MEVNETNVTRGILGILSVLILGIGAVSITPDQLDNAFICSINENVVLGVDHLSSTEKTAYWIDENNQTESKVCRGGFWLDLKQYAKDHDLDLNILLQEDNEVIVPGQDVPGAAAGIKWECSPSGCIKLE